MALVVKLALGLALVVAAFALLVFVVKIAVAMAFVAAVSLAALYLVNFVRAFGRRLAARGAVPVAPRATLMR